MKDEKMTTNEVVQELTEKEIAQGAFNVVKKEMLRKLSAKTDEESNMLTILELDEKEFMKKFSVAFMLELIRASEYTNTWTELLKKSSNMEEFVMSLHKWYKLQERMTEVMQDPLQALFTLLAEKG